MNRIIIRFLSSRKVLYSLVAGAAASAFSCRAGAFEYEGVWYATLDSERVEVTPPPSGETYNLSEYAIPSTIEYSGARYRVAAVGMRAFYGNDSLVSVILPEGIERIGAKAFAFCPSLTMPEWPSTLGQIDENAFSYCDAIEGELLLPAGIRLEAGVFSFCRGLTRVDLSNAEVADAPSLLRGCAALTEVIFNPELTVIPGFMLADCRRLENVELPVALVGIGEQAFANCSMISSLEIPADVKTIGERAFSNCPSLARLTFLTSDLDIGSGAFEHDLSLPWLYLNGICRLGDNCFDGCTSLSWIEIEDGVEEIGENAFSGCTSLRAVYSHSLWPPRISFNTFDRITFESASLEVPEGAADRYRLAAYWNQFSYVGETDLFPVSLECIGADNGSIRVYGIDGRLVEVIEERSQKIPSMKSGVYILRTSGGTKKVVL